MAVNLWRKAYLDLKEHIANGVSPEVWLLSRKEYNNKAMATQYREMGDVTLFLDWLLIKAAEEDAGREFDLTMRPIVGGSFSEGRL
jgi:hypothetical protein